MDTIKNIQNVVEVRLQSALRNPYIMAILKIVLILYASQIAPKISPTVTSIFQFTIVKILSIALIAYVAEVDFQLSIILAVVFVLSMNLLSGRGPLESYENDLSEFQMTAEEHDVEKFEDSVPGSFTDKLTDLLGNPAKVNGFTLLESHSDEFVGCQNVKLADLLAIFDNDALKLQNTVQFTYHQLMQNMEKGTAKENLIKIARSVGLPYNVPLNDENSPFIATLLLQWGYTINKTCTAPN
jgi:hypothetical protein